MNHIDNLLPNFFIIGAAKSGTTTLFQALQDDPRVYFPASKEPGFFSRDDEYARGVEVFARQHFQKAAGCPARGEATTTYLYWSEKVAPRMQAYDTRGDVRLVAIFRDPVARAYSMYWHGRRHRWETLPTFEEALAAEESRLAELHDELYRSGSNHFGYYREGCYAARLQPFLTCFPRERILLLLQEDFKTDFQGTIRRTLEFLGVESGLEFEARVGNAPALARSRTLSRLLNRPSLLRSLARRLMPASMRVGVKGRLRSANRAPDAYPPIDPATESALRDRYRDEMLRFQSMIGRDLSGWIDPSAGRPA